MIKGIIYIIIASFAYGILPVFSSLLLKAGMNSQSVVAFRFFFAAIGVAIILLVKKISVKVTAKQFVQLLVFGLIGYGGTALLLTASYQFLPIGLCTMFHFSYPLVVTVIMAILYKEKITIGKFLAILSALLGIFLLAELSDEGFQIKGMVLALCSSITYSIYVISSKKSAFSTLPPLVVVFYVEIFLFIFFTAQCALSANLTIPPNWKSWLFVIFAGMVCSVIGLLMLNKSIRIIGATNAAIGNLLEPITSLIAGAVVYGDIISSRALAGCLLVLVAVFLAAADSKIKFLSNTM